MTSPYYFSYACLDCRKAFKRERRDERKIVCPDCGGDAHDFGRHFKPPKKDDLKQWDKIRFLFEHGFHFQKIRVGHDHYDTVPYPDTLEEAREFVEKYKEFAFKDGGD